MRRILGPKAACDGSFSLDCATSTMWKGEPRAVKPLCRRLLRPSAVRIGHPATIIRTSLIYPVRGATNRAKCILLGFPETKSSLPASFLNGRNHQVDLNADRKASASLPAFRHAVDPYLPGDGHSRIAISW